jgi:hypothetical protein
MLKYLDLSALNILSILQSLVDEISSKHNQKRDSVVTILHDSEGKKEVIARDSKVSQWAMQAISAQEHQAERSLMHRYNIAKEVIITDHNLCLRHNIFGLC